MTWPGTANDPILVQQNKQSMFQSCIKRLRNASCMTEALTAQNVAAIYHRLLPKFNSPDAQTSPFLPFLFLIGCIFFLLVRIILDSSLCAQHAQGNNQERNDACPLHRFISTIMPRCIDPQRVENYNAYTFGVLERNVENKSQQVAVLLLKHSVLCFFFVVWAVLLLQTWNEYRLTSSNCPLHSACQLQTHEIDRSK